MVSWSVQNKAFFLSRRLVGPVVNYTNTRGLIFSQVRLICFSSCNIIHQNHFSQCKMVILDFWELTVIERKWPKKKKTLPLQMSGACKSWSTGSSAPHVSEDADTSPPMCRWKAVFSLFLCFEFHLLPFGVFGEGKFFLNIFFLKQEFYRNWEAANRWSWLKMGWVDWMFVMNELHLLFRLFLKWINNHSRIRPDAS